MRTGIAAIVLSLLIVSPALCAEVTLADAQAEFAAGQYRPCLQKIASAMAGQAGRIGSPERYDLLMLRGDCLLQLKRGDMAAEAYDAASRSVKDQRDLKRVGPARAMAILIRASSNLTYKPKGGTAADSIDIVNPESRKKALEVMLKERLDAIQPQVEGALKATTIPPMTKVVPPLLEAFMIETAAKGEAKETLAIGEPVGQHARELIQTQLQRIAGKLEELSALASEPTISSGPRDFLGPRGLTSPERDQIHLMADELTKIKQLAQDARQINRSLGGTGEVWDAILVQTQDCMDLAESVYNRRY